MKIYFILLLLFCQSGNGQEAAKCFWPDGTRFITEAGTIKSYLDSVGIKYYHDFDYKDAVLFFYPLSDQLAFAWANNPEHLKIAKAAYKHSVYVKSEKFESDLRYIFYEGSLDTIYLIKTLGTPDRRTQDMDTYYWGYDNYSVKFTISGHLAVAHQIIHYKDILRHQLALSDYSVSGDDYSAGFSIALKNYSKKTIKYIWFTVRATNPVGDLVGVKVAKGVGPIESNTSGSYQFESLFYSRVVDQVKLVGIRIEYMDKSTQTIPTQEIKKLWVDK